MSVNLNASQVSTNQDQADVTVNDATGRLDAAMTEDFEVLINASEVPSTPLTAEQFRANIVFVLSPDAPGPGSSPITFAVPSTKRGIFVVRNNTGFDAEVLITGQSEPAAEVPSGDIMTLHSDGVDVRSVGGGSTGGPVLSPFTVTNTVEDFVLTVANAALTTLATDSTFMRFTADADGAPASVALSLAQFAPDATSDNIITLGDPAGRWEALYVGTGTSIFEGHVEIDNAMELRLYEANGSGTNYSAFKAQAQAGNITYTLPAADASGGLESDGAGALTWFPQPYDVVGFFATTPANGELITRVVFNRAVSMATNLTSSQGFLGTAATASTTFDLQKNGVSFGSMVFAAAGTVATFSSSATSFAAGDRFEIVGPNPADATAANLSYALRATRS